MGKNKRKNHKKINGNTGSENTAAKGLEAARKKLYGDPTREALPDWMKARISNKGKTLPEDRESLSDNPDSQKNPYGAVRHFPDDAVEFLMENAIRLFHAQSHQDETPEIQRMVRGVACRVEANKESLKKKGFRVNGSCDLIEYTQKLSAYNTLLYHHPAVAKILHDTFNLPDQERYQLGGHGQDMIDDENRDEILSTLTCVHEMASVQQGGIRVLDEFLQSVRDIGGDNTFFHAEMHDHAAERLEIERNYKRLCDEFRYSYPGNPVLQPRPEGKTMPKQAHVFQ